MQWISGPLYCRSHEIDSSVSALVSAGGRIFYILDEGLTGITDERLPSQWVLIARDAFNGIQLWKRPLPDWGWQAWKRSEMKGKDWTALRSHRIRSPSILPRRLVAVGNRVYVTPGYRAPVIALDAATGDLLRQYDRTEGTDEILWTQGVLVLSVRRDLVSKVDRKTDESLLESLLAVDAETGERLWEMIGERILPLGTAAGGKRVLFHNHSAIVCLDLRSGLEQWRAPVQAPKGSEWIAAATLVAHEDVVLFATPEKITALDLPTGEVLWTDTNSRGPGISNPPDLFITGNTVWYGGYEREKDRQSVNQNTHVYKTGHDVRTGAVKETLHVENLISPGHHFRCFRSKATTRYLLWPKRGIEFIDLEADDHMRHDWLRAPCKLGFMPANGLLYTPPHQCFCYPGVKLGGFNALAATRLQAPAPEKKPRFVQGLAFEQTSRSRSVTPDRADWPTYRRDLLRSGSTESKIPTHVTKLWEAEIGGRLTQPVVLEDQVFLASIDAHTLYALATCSGTPEWTYTAGGRIDSPPTIHRDLVLFGSADGWVYCLRKADGALVWRFRAAPEERRLIAFGQIESAWPVHGSVLIKDDVAYVSAGRSSYLDGGIYIYGLDPATGEVLHHTRLDGPHPDLTSDVGRPSDMEGALSDVLVSDGDRIYMYQTVLDSDLRELEAPRLTDLGDRKVGRHLISTAGLLDDSWWNRTFWMVSERWPGFYIANQAPKSGQLLVFDATTTYGVKCYTRRNRHSPMFFPGTDGYLLFADDNDTEPVLVDQTGKPQPVKWLPTVNEAVGFKLDGVAVNRDKATGFTRAKPPKWAVQTPVRVRAMVLAGETLFAAGPPDLLDPEDPLAAFEGRKGGILQLLSAVDGSVIAEHKLDSPPVFDGMIAARERLFISTRDGRLLCMGEEGESS
jgi:outer membrane protein assembly factor BamB